MAAGRYDITIEQGATFTRTFTYEEPEGTPVDLTGYGISAMVRGKPSDASPLLTFAVSAIALSAGQFQLWASATATAALSASDPPSRRTGVWDCELWNGSTCTKLVYGDVFIKPEATK